MGATVLEHRFGCVFLSLTPSSVTSLTSSAQSFNCGGLLPIDQILNISSPSFQAGISQEATVNSAGVLTVAFANGTNAPVAPAPGNYKVSWFRPDAGPRSTVVGT